MKIRFHHRGVRTPHAVAACILLTLLAACGRVSSTLRQATLPESPHARYAQSLRDAGLDSTALGRDWLVAADASLAAAAPVALPFREAGYFGESEARAVAYRVRARRGQRIVARAETESAQPARLFMDVFEPARDSADTPDRFAGADSGTTVTFEAERDGDYLLRLQPELLRSLRYVLTIDAEASLSFPVDGRGSRAVQSFFGVARDGGRREHHGIDIFAPRGTPVVAAAPGIANPRDNRLGGKVVWVYDPVRNRSLYYAHLDSQIVTAGQLVRAGDTLGLVGNTGNARTTPPHLHFGIYQRGEGPVDPFPFVDTRRSDPPALAADTSHLGGWRRVDARRGVALYASPNERDSTLRTLPRRTVVRVEGATGRYFRVRLPDGTPGYVAAAGTAAASTPLESVRRDAETLIRDRPSAVAATVDRVEAGTSVPVLGRFDAYLFVRAPSGRTGWVGADE